MMHEEDDEIRQVQPSNPTYSGREDEDEKVSTGLQFICPAIKSLMIHSQKNSRVTKTAFKIETEFITGKSYTVERTLKNFEWLHQAITEEFPGCIIPPKSLIQLHKDDAKNLFLEKFIERVVLHEKLRVSKRLYEFLTLDIAENMIVDDQSASNSGVLFNLKMWRKSGQTANLIDEETLNYFKLLRTDIEGLILNSKRVQDKQRELMDCMEQIGRELKIFGNTDKQSHDRFHQVGDKLMELYTVDLSDKKISEEKPSTIVRYRTTKFEKALEWYRSFFIPGVIAYLELPQHKGAELQIAKDTLVDLQKKLDPLEAKNNDANFVKTPKHERAYLEAKLKVKQQNELVNKTQAAVTALEQNRHFEIAEFKKKMQEEIGEGLLQFLDYRVNSYKTTAAQFETIRQSA